MAQRFYISITLVGQNHYLVRTEQVVPGVPLAETLVTLPLADWWIQTDQLINDALKVGLQDNEIVGESGSNPLAPLQSKIINLGEQLYKALFQGSLKESWIKAQEIAQTEQEVLQLRLKLNEPLLARLPWEILHTGNYFLAIEPSIAFSRYQVGATPALQHVVMLMAIAMPNPQSSLALKQAAKKLQAEHQLSQVDQLLNESAVDYVGLDAREIPSLEDVMSDFIEPARELDLLDDEEWDEGVDVGYDDPTYEEDSAVVADLFRQATQPAAAESPIVPASTLNQLPEVTSSNTKSLPPIPQPNHQSQKLAECLQSEESTPATTDTPQVRSLKAGFPHQRSVQKVLPILQTVGVTAIAFMGFWWFQQQPQQSPPPLPLSQPAAGNLKTVSTSELQAIAIEHFNKGNLSAGCLAVEELLNRGALQSGNTALNTVSEVQAKTSTINFLRGRLAWQSINSGEKNYSLDDVRRYWEAAVKDKPDSLQYHNALGFVYYIQGDLNSANQTWFQALYLVEEQAKNAASPDVVKRDQLNAYAGLALVLSKLAENQPSDKQAKLLSEAINLRQKVLTAEPINFQPQKLSKTWLWTEKAIQDWRSLLKLKK